MSKFSYFDEDMLDAMAIYKNTFTLVDARLINLIHSYSKSGQPFFASNQYLAEKCFTTPATIQKSINKLIDYNLVNKKVSCEKGKKQRVLTYNEEAVIKFKTEALNHRP